MVARLLAVTAENVDAHGCDLRLRLRHPMMLANWQDIDAMGRPLLGVGHCCALAREMSTMTVQDMIAQLRGSIVQIDDQQTV